MMPRSEHQETIKKICSSIELMGDFIVRRILSKQIVSARFGAILSNNWFQYPDCAQSVDLRRANVCSIYEWYQGARSASNYLHLRLPQAGTARSSGRPAG